MGETLLALDGRTYELDESMVVICDDNGPESLAGVMGGEASGCDESTTDVLIETALWDPMNIAHTGRKLGIVTDARYRFERGVDPAFALPGIELATQLVLEFCGGEPSELALAGELPRLSRAINFPWSETKRLTGLDAPREDAACNSRAPWLQRRERRRRHRPYRRAELAPGHRGQGRYRRGSRPHDRRRQCALDAAAARRRRRAAPC